MITLRARWVLPIASPVIERGWVAVDDGHIVGIGQERRATVRGAGADVDLGRVALMPALVNAHTHLELCWLAKRVPAAGRFTDWIRQVMALRRTQPDPASADILEPMRRGIAALHRSGVGLVGDISNTLVSVAALAEESLPGAVFFEQIRFRAADAAAVVEDARRRLEATPVTGDVRVRLAAHAPYSVSARLFEQIRATDPKMRQPTSVHAAESREEVELLREGQGPWRDLLEELGAWDPAWTPPRCGPIEYLDRLGWVDRDVLLVHGVQVTDTDLRTIADQGATLVTCPRSNRHVGAGDPPVARFYDAGVRVAVGTDSLASAPDLSIWPELARMRALAPEVPPRRLLESATSVGAEALGFGDAYGTIEAGKRAALIAVAVPPDVDDVEAYLVSGVEPSQVGWIS